MPVENLAVAGIDIGSNSHFVGIGQKNEDVKEFGLFNEYLYAFCKHLVANEITTIALESTAVTGAFVCIVTAVQSESYIG